MITMFLANLIGWYFIIMGLLMLLKSEYIQAAVTDILAQPGLYFVVAAWTLVLGLMMVITHNLWVSGWALIITLIAWITLISALLRLFAPELARDMAKSFISNSNTIKVTGLILLIIGIFLLFCVYSINFGF